MRRLNSQTLILIGTMAFVLYLAGVPLLMLLYGSIRRAPIGEPGATFTIQNYIKAYFDRDFSFLFLNSLYYALGTCLLTFEVPALIGVPAKISVFNSTVLSIMAFDLWEGGQIHLRLCAGGFDGFVAPGDGIYRA